MKGTLENNGMNIFPVVYNPSTRNNLPMLRPLAAFKS